MSKDKLLLATRNRAKVREYSKLLRGIPYTIVSLQDVGVEQEVEEAGDSFEENAILKAKTYAKLSGLITMADDSGLEVDALDGAPGILSARYAGDGATDGERIEYLLSNMVNILWEKRSARFRCAIAIASSEGEVRICKGTCPGIITFEPRGENGFGYDPVFYLPDRDRTMAELSMEEKNEISHRGRAAAEARRLLM